MVAPLASGCPALTPEQAKELYRWLCDRLRNGICPAVMRAATVPIEDQRVRCLVLAVEYAAARIEEVLAAVKACGTAQEPLAGPGFLSGPQEWRP